MRSCTMPPRNPGKGVAIATSTHRSIEKIRPATATASSEMAIPCVWLKPQMHREDVRDQLDPVNDNRRQQKRRNRQRAHADQQHVDRAGDVLTPPAMAALGQVLLIVGPHRRREPRDIVSPAGENIPHHLIRYRWYGIFGAPKYTNVVFFITL